MVNQCRPAFNPLSNLMVSGSCSKILKSYGVDGQCMGTTTLPNIGRSSLISVYTHANPPTIYIWGYNGYNSNHHNFSINSMTDLDLWIYLYVLIPFLAGLNEIQEEQLHSRRWRRRWRHSRNVKVFSLNFFM